MRYLLDTNIIIYSLKDSYPAIRSHFMRTPPQSIAIPLVVMSEIEYGARKSQDYGKTIETYRAFTDYFDKAGFTEKSAYYYGLIRHQLEKDETPIVPNDLMIAAITMAEDGILVTHNTKEFRRIPGLKIEDWTEY